MVDFVRKAGAKGAAMARRGRARVWPRLTSVLLQAELGDAGEHLTRVALDKSLNSRAGHTAVLFSSVPSPRPGVSSACSRAPPMSSWPVAVVNALAKNEPTGGVGKADWRR
jgi:hypothetical protein